MSILILGKQTILGLLRAAVVACFVSMPPIAASDQESQQPAPSDIRFLTHSLGDAAYIDDNGLLHGRPHAGRRAFFAEMVLATMKEMDAVQPVQQVSLNRGLFLLGEDNYALFSLIITEDRRSKYKWVGRWALWGLGR